MFFMVLRMVFGLVFIYAGGTKIPDPAGFAETIVNYRILPASLVSPAAVFIPWIEVLCGLSLVFGVFARGGALLLDLMLGAFTASVAYNWWRGLDIECGCFGDAEIMNAGMAAATIRDAALLLIGLVVLWRVCRPKRKYVYK
jgi:uncharacterized membrane protein YphA (DoxX/SURF4 family)